MQESGHRERPLPCKFIYFIYYTFWRKRSPVNLWVMTTSFSWHGRRDRATSEVVTLVVILLVWTRIRRGNTLNEGSMRVSMLFLPCLLRRYELLRTREQTRLDLQLVTSSVRLELNWRLSSWAIMNKLVFDLSESWRFGVSKLWGLGSWSGQFLWIEAVYVRVGVFWS